MHYEDEEVTDNNELQVVFYKHTTGPWTDVWWKEVLYKLKLKKKITNEYEMQLASVQKCQYVHPYILKMFFEQDWNEGKGFEVVREIFDDLKEETWNLFTITWDDNADTNNNEPFYVSCKEVCKSDNEFHRLH